MPKWLRELNYEDNEHTYCIDKNFIYSIKSITLMASNGKDNVIDLCRRTRVR